MFLAALAGTGAAANGANLIVKGRPAPPKLPPVETKPMPLLGEVAAPVPPTRVFNSFGILVSSTTFVPVTVLRDALDVRLAHAGNPPAWTLKLGETTVVLAPGQTTSTVNGRVMRFSEAPRLIRGELFVPARAVGSALGLNVSKRGANVAIFSATGRKALVLQNVAPKLPPAPGMMGPPRLPRP
jgi:hypothetical protein